MNGISSDANWVTVVGRVNSGLVEPIPNTLRIHPQSHGPLVAVRRVGDHDSLVPVDPLGEDFIATSTAGMIGPMDGGNIATVSLFNDSAFVQWLTGAPQKFGIFLNIHDRFETPELYRALSD